jgi:hypothetical protein
MNTFENKDLMVVFLTNMGGCSADYFSLNAFTWDILKILFLAWW